MSEKTALFFASIDGFDEDKIYNLSRDIERVGKKYGISIWLDAVIEAPTE
jgi:hypothetical protein